MVVEKTELQHLQNQSQALALSANHEQTEIMK